MFHLDTLPGKGQPITCLCSSAWADFFSFKCGQTAVAPGRDPSTSRARTVPDVPVQITWYEDAECGRCSLISLFFLSQVAQWPEKEEEEQPMFGEEYDW